MLYSDSQKTAVAKQLQQKLVSGEAEGHEIVVALISMVKAGRLKLDDVAPILMTVYFENPSGAIRALAKAHGLIDDEMIDSIVKEVSAN